MNKLLSQLQVYWSTRWFRRSIIGTAIFLLILIAIPLALHFAIVQQLEQRGAHIASIEDIDLNPFAGTFTLENLQFTASGAQTGRIGWVSVDMDMLQLVTGQISVQEIRLSGINLVIEHLENNSVLVNGLQVVDGTATNTEPTTESDENSSPGATFAISKVKLEQIDVEYRETDFTQPFSIANLKLENLDSGDPDKLASLELEMRLREAPFKLNSDLQLFTPQQRIKGEISLAQLQFAPYQKFYRDHLANIEGHINIDGDFDLNLGDEITGSARHKIEIADLKLEYKQLNQVIQKIQLRGSTKLQAGNTPRFDGDLKITKSHTRDSVQKTTLASFAGLQISNISVDLMKQAVANINLDQLEIAVTNEDNKMLHLNNLSITGIQFQPQQATLAIEQVALDEPVLQLTITEKKDIAQLKPIQDTLTRLTADPGSSDSDATEEAAEKSAKPFHFDIASVKLLQPGKLEFTDQSVSPRYSTTIRFNKLDVNGVSTQDPANFVISLQQNEHSHVEIEGKGLLMDPTKQIAFTGKIKQLDLPPVTPYTTAVMGYGMKSGVIDSDLEVKIDQREIDSKVSLKIDSIEVVETNTKTAEAVSSASGMSIDLAVSTLKDENNVIELELPISGNLDEPDFDLSKIINKALGKAMQSASLSYLKHTLQPFGALVTLFDLVNSAANHISLPPIVFEPNSLEFEPQQGELVGKVIKVLIERPALKIKTCAVSAPADAFIIKQQLILEAKARIDAAKAQQVPGKKQTKTAPQPVVVIDQAELQQRLRALADSRASKLKKLFIVQGKLESKRILNCLSRYTDKEGAKPLVELQI